MDSKTAKAVDVEMNEIQNMRLILNDLEGQPIDAKVTIEGHMPGHVHGLPTQPEVSQQQAPGIYLVEGMKFQMGGWWVIDFHIDNDRIRFNVVL